MQGKDLLKKLITASGLPESSAHLELSRLIDAHGKPAHEITLDDLRELLADYLQEVLLESKKQFSQD